MFSSSNGITHFAQLSPYLYPSSSSSSSLGLNDNNEALLLHHHQDLLSHYHTVAPIVETANIMMTTNTASTSNPQISSSNPLHTRYCRKQPVKRDRHSKICTAQGPRDRRVRLSMDIARKFFGLQDLLGYGKASQTLDWLLNKSKAAIKELLEMKGTGHDANAKCLCFWSEASNVVAAGTSTEEDESKKTASVRKRKKTTQAKNPKGAKNPKMVELDKLVKESRAKARARARERTREKFSLRKLSEDQKLPDLIPFSPDQSRPAAWSQIGTCNTSESNMLSTISSLKLNVSTEEVDGIFGFNHRTGERGIEEIFQESLRIERKAKSSSILGFQRNLILSKEASPNFNSWSPITNENWGISTSKTWSSLCAVTNMSSSKVLQICGKPSEDQSNNNQSSMWWPD